MTEPAFTIECLNGVKIRFGLLKGSPGMFYADVDKLGGKAAGTLDMAKFGELLDRGEALRELGGEQD